jgi:hypothetical protein
MLIEQLCAWYNITLKPYKIQKRTLNLIESLYHFIIDIIHLHRYFPIEQHSYPGILNS